MENWKREWCGSGSGRENGRRVSWGHEGRAVNGGAASGARKGGMSRPAFSRTDLMALVVLVVVMGFLGLVLMPARGRSRSARPLKDQTQVRGIAQGMMTWASGVNDVYPTPSTVDLVDSTVAERGIAKDTTANVLSLMVFLSVIAPEICVSPAEMSQKVRVKENYQYDRPSRAVVPDQAVWDPSFKGTPLDLERVMGVGVGTAAGESNQSYGFMIPVGKRKEMWSNTYAATTPIMGNRGPTYVQDDFGALAGGQQAWGLMEGELGTRSNTLGIHGRRDSWEGNIAFADGHVEFWTKPTGAATYTRRSATRSGAAAQVEDNLFVNESNEAEGDQRAGVFDRGRNAYLRATWRLGADGSAGVWRD